MGHSRPNRDEQTKEDRQHAHNTAFDATRYPFACAHKGGEQFAKWPVWPMADTDPPLQMLNNPRRFMFFTGKGGVGKTSIACSCALALSDAGFMFGSAFTSRKH